MLYDEHYWNPEISKKSSREQVSGKQLDRVFQETKNKFSPAIYRLAVACRFEGIDCSSSDRAWLDKKIKYSLFHAATLIPIRDYDELLSEIGVVFLVILFIDCQMNGLQVILRCGSIMLREIQIRI